MKRILRIIRNILFLWVLFVAVSLIIPPLQHKQTVTKQESEITNEKLLPTERVCSIDQNMDALIWRLRLLESARNRIVLATFDFRDDQSGKDIMAALWKAAQRGVQVQILVDGISVMQHLRNSSSFQELVLQNNVEVKVYNPVTLLEPWKNNYRMHDKYLIADDFAYILGGRNTDDLFLGNYAEVYNEDRDILVYETDPGMGRSYRQLQNYFERIWNLSCCRTYDRTTNVGQVLEERYQMVKNTYPEAFEEPDWIKETIEADSIELYTNSPQPNNKEPQLWDKIIEEISQTKEVLIQTPYIICNRKMYQDLTNLCTSGISTEVMINAVESGTNPFGCTDYLNQKEEVRKTGCTVYEYLGEQALHTKTILAGDELSIVGSCNMDMRSVYLDTEMMLFIKCRELNQELKNQTEILKRSGRKILPDGTISDGQDYKEKKQGLKKKITYGILRMLIVPFRHLL